MKRILAVFGLASMVAVAAFAASRETLWKEVDQAARQGLPRTAITNLQTILEGALREHAYPEAVKALARRIALEGSVESGRAEERIARLEAELPGLPAQMAPVVETVLAYWYWQYFQENRWRFMQRTASAAPAGDDIRTWDLARILSEVDQRFQRALAAGPELKRVPIADWDALLVKGTMPDALRPTLYDFIAHEALKFYTAGEQAGSRPQDDYKLRSDAPVFGTVQEFLDWQPAATPEVAQTSSVLKALALYQALLRFHQDDPEPKLAFVHNDLERLTWAWNTAVGPAKDSAYEAALRQFIQSHENLELSALAAERLAWRLHSRDELVLARQTALRAAEAFPDSPGGILCRALVDQIEAKSFEVRTEGVWNAPWPDIQVTYRNVQTLYFRAIPYDWEIFLDRKRNRPQNLSQTERREVLSRSAALEWSFDLPPTTDYRQREFSPAAPSSLKPGFYFIVASHKPDFSEQDNVLQFCDVWVSELAMVLRSRNGRIEGFIMEANSGEPVQNAAISAWHLNQSGVRVAEPEVRTDANGFFSLRAAPHRGYLVRARQGARELASIGDFSTHEVRQEDASRRQTFLFSDRAIYRPGQTVQYKGICVSVDTDRDRYEAAKGEDVTVVFMDANGKEIARQQHRANDYGSFAGSFTAPRDRLMGMMTLSVQGRAPGMTHVRVEEYKRPKFEVTLEAPASAPKLNERVVLTGRAMTYADAPVDNSEVRFRVTREAHMPWWWLRGRGLIWPPRPTATQEIAHGTARTGVDGSFTVEFVAQPDLEIPEQDDPSFSFHINAEVTDTAGETRSADRRLNVGYSALQAMITADEWQTGQKPVELKVSTRTLDGDPQVASGTIFIHELLAPSRVVRPELTGPVYPYWRGQRPSRPGGDTNNQAEPENWPLGRTVSELRFETGTNGQATVRAALPAGAYRAIIDTRDRFGRKVTGQLTILVLNPEGEKLSSKVPHLLTAPTWEVQPGETFVALWGTGYDSGRAFIEIEHRDRVIRSFWTEPNRTQRQFELAVTEAMRGGFILRVTRVRENRAYLDTKVVQVPWKNKELELKWEHFVSRLQPGQRETWTLAIKGGGTNTESALAEMVATLYDESLDAFAPHSWLERFEVFRREQGDFTAAMFQNTVRHFEHGLGAWDQPQRQSARIAYRSFPPELLVRDIGRGIYPTRGRWYRNFGGDAVAHEAVQISSAPMPSLMLSAAAKPSAVFARSGLSPEVAETAPTPPSAASRTPVDLSQVSARRNLNETAFFFPQLTSNSNGTVRLTFTMPEALTQWRFLGFAHDRELRSGFLKAQAVTSKNLMVQPNPPRFLREGDTVEFTVKVSNQSDEPQAGTVRLTFAQLQDESSADRLLGNTRPEQAFDIPARQSRAFSWRITVPDGCGFLSYKAVAAAAQVSDGEEGAIPVLSRRVLVTESLPLPIRGPATKQFELAKLLKSAESDSLQHRNFTVQMVSNPAWYAVLALPYLMEYPHECSEQVFNRYYANALARHIASSNPEIRRVFDQWKNTPALDSPLEKNQDLKAVLIEETPWLRQAQNESQARRNVGVLFDSNRLDAEAEKTLQKLLEMQIPGGMWPWFPGGYANRYITLYIATGFGRLRHLGVELNPQLAIAAWRALDTEMAEKHRKIREKPEPEKYIPDAEDALYLYGRSFFLKDLAVEPAQQPAVDFFLAQARTHWLDTGRRQSQAHLALALHRFNAVRGGNDSTPAAILRSLKERSVSGEEMGMSWRDAGSSWWWHQAPIETHALMIEAFDEVARDAQSVEELRAWLLKQKQTTDWKTTKATADATYALLLRGRDLLADKQLVRVKAGGQDLTPAASGSGAPGGKASAVEPGTGFYEVRFGPAEVRPQLGNLLVEKSNPGVAWGGAHWQYLEDISKVLPHSDTPLKLTKSLHKKVNTDRGPVLQPATGPLSPGDELVVRIELRTDRDMEYVHLKDQRGSGTEPVSVLSQYKYQDSLGYYESTRDTASHFFIDYLRRGTYVFEYSTRVQLRGEYQSGVAEIQCMYAPEFNSHSGSVALRVR